MDKFENDEKYLHETDVLAWKAAAMSGSSSIMRLPFTATLSLRSRIYRFTQALNTSPRTEKATFEIHYLGNLRISL